MFVSKFRKYAKWNSFTVGFADEFHRVVNQEEIVDYFKQNPGKTESEMQLDVYGYVRRKRGASNKKYADRLRDALYSGKLRRELVQKGSRKVFIYFAN